MGSIASSFDEMGTAQRKELRPPLGPYSPIGRRIKPLSLVGTLRTLICAARQPGTKERGRTNGVGGPASRAPALDRDNGVPLLEDAKLESFCESVADSVVDLDDRQRGWGRGRAYVNLPCLVGGGLGLVVMHRVATSVQVDLSSGLLVPRDYPASAELAAGMGRTGDDWTGGTVLAHESSRVARGGHDENSACVLLQRGRDGRDGDRLGGGGGSLHKCS